MWTYNTIVVLLGAALLGAMCGMVGCFTVLKRRALLGDVIAHATLPGLGLAFLITELKELPILLTGALVTGLLGVWGIALMRHKTRTKEDAAMALVLSVLFGAGISLSNYIQSSITEGSKAGLDSYILGKTAGIVRSDVILVGVLSLFAVLCITFCYKEFRLCVFDPDYAKTLGRKVLWIDFGLMGLLAMAVVVGLPMVGVVMIAALCLLPAVSARFWTDHLSMMLLLAGVFGVLSSCAGVLLSSLFEKTPTGPTIILGAGVLFLLSALLSPKHGVVALYSSHLRHRWNWGVFLILREMRASGSIPLNELGSKMFHLGIMNPFFTRYWGILTRKVEIQEKQLVPTPLGLRWLQKQRERIRDLYELD